MQNFQLKYKILLVIYKYNIQMLQSAFLHHNHYFILRTHYTLIYFICFMLAMTYHILN